MKIRTIHIHTDYKFVVSTSRFFGEYFDNTLVVIEGNEPYKGPFNDIVLRYTEDQIDLIVELCNTADLVVLYDLNYIKSRIVVRIKPNVKIVWRFFGYELYGRILEDLLQPETKKYLPGITHKILSQIKVQFRNIHQSLKYGLTNEEVFRISINRLDLMLILSSYEYNFILKYFNYLPDYVELPYGSLYSEGTPNLNFDINKKENVIIIGNSRSIYNNHLDTIKLIETAKSREIFKFKLLMNYGRKSKYYYKVLESVKGMNHYDIIDTFIEIDKFKLFYSDASALIINGIRQMAMGNISYAIQNGVKIYLNPKNVKMQWFLDNEIFVYSVYDFPNDLENNNIKLDEVTATKNINSLQKLYVKYTNDDFQSRIILKLGFQNHIT